SPARPPRRLALLSLAFALGACGSGDGVGPPTPEPPVPENLGDFDPEASARVEKALAAVRAGRRSAQAWADLRAVYYSERLKGPAIECTRVAEGLEPAEARWPYRTAILLAQNGALEEATAAMQRSLALKPGYAPSHARLGNYRLQLGDLEGAEHAFRAAI